jgi:hypothetical protein
MTITVAQWLRTAVGWVFEQSILLVVLVIGFFLYHWPSRNRDLPGRTDT